MIQADTERSGSSEQSTDQFRFGTWYPISTYDGLDGPHDGVDLWMDIPASPKSFGWGDAFRVANAFRITAKWFHMEGTKQRELDAGYITHWMPLPPAPSNVDRPDEAGSDAGRLNQLHSIRDTTIEDCARVARQTGADHCSDDSGEFWIVNKVEEAIRALKDKNPREE